MTHRSFVPLVLTWLASSPIVSTGSGDDRASCPPEVAPLERDGWEPNAALVAELDRQKVTWNYREANVPDYRLPDPLRGEDGTPVADRGQWERKRRPEILDLFRKYVYGRSPARPPEVRFDVIASDPDTMGGRATLRRVRITSRDGGKAFAFTAAVLVPNRSPGRVPAFVLINNRPESSADPARRRKEGFWPAEAIIARGFATAVFQTNDVDPDREDDAARAAGVRGQWPAGAGREGEDAWATLGAWAWGASRVLDYLETVPEIGPARVAVVGHSRGGKAALWAGAQDERFALVVSNDSGCGGAALSRRRFGETVEAINRSFPHWFCGNFKQFNGHEDELPVDQHQLLALIAPRALYVASADGDFWADQRGEFLALAHASPVYALYGYDGLKPTEMPPLNSPRVRGRMGYHIRQGNHNLTPYDWQQFMDYADRLWPDRPRR
jgi:hypothetical protein